MSVLTALFQNATNFQPTSDDVLAPRISKAHLPHVEACSRTPQPPTSISVDQNSACHWRHSQNLLHAPSTFQHFEELIMDTRCKACAPGTPCGTELRDGT